MQRMTIRALLATATAVLALATATTGPAAAGELVLYTASNPEIEKDVMAAFQAAHPDITVKAVNMSTGPITEKAIAEKGNPQADVIWMVNDFALAKLKQDGVLAPYTPRGMIIDDAFKDTDGFWYGHNATIMAMAVNTRVLTEKGLPEPTDWVDLIRPDYKDQVTVAAPTKSGTGFTIFTAMDDMFGWNFIDNLHQNVVQYNSSGSAAARQVSAGENAIGLSYDTAILQQVQANPDVKLVIGRMSPNIIEGAGLVAGGPNPQDGQVFMDWLFGRGGMTALAPHVGIGAAPGFGNVPLDQVHLWKTRRPIDQDGFKQAWAKRYEN
ncbi:extracellular solute-binding protein (plasmid) [Tistrella bauzanensis]|uniref:extracellular solute-binding protein n=1 Tax=Tistrella TaxID=171436 RepID=UPI0031F692F1